MNFQRPSYGQLESVSPENIRARARLISPTRPQLGRPRVSTKSAKAAFRPLSVNSRAALLRMMPSMRGEVAGLSETGAQWIVEKGDTGSKIAQKLTGSAGRWTELRSVNPTIMARDPKLVKQYGFPIYVGDKVNLPADWIKVVAKPPAQSAPATASPSTAPPVEIPGGDLAAQGQARTILAAFGRSDGVNEPGIVRDYGGQSELQATGWTGRDVLQGDAFAGWWKRNGGFPTVDSGYWSDNLARALNAWAERKATQVANTALSGGGIVIPPLVTQPQAATPAATTPGATTPGATTPAVTTPALLGSAMTALGSAIQAATTPAATTPAATTPAATTPAATTPAATTPAATTPAATTPAATTPSTNDNAKWGVASVVLGVVSTTLIRILS